jgi:hypothetical protein
MKRLGLALGIVLLAQMIIGAAATDLNLKLADQPAPAEVSDAIKQTLQNKSIQLLDGDKLAYQFWFRSEIPLKAKPESAAKALSSLAELTFLGVVTVGEGRRDYKDNEIAPGTYTMRFGLQPQDGDHLGTSEFPFFAVLIPIKSDPDPQGLKTYKSMVKASGKGTATGHPVVLSLRPASGEGGVTPKLVTPAPEHKAILLTIPAKASEVNQPSGISFELVYEGKFKS